ncbi:MAG: tRNA (guanosine(37)-N1)-methyltransferase TrmD [Candidatus Moeniiplasma glomeromycotorum]|nr:tRNA (guanosine(37)-N1)-methyltransferase TrmD [Candidatus Moeniiplasma glomeromycotorum]MCE8167638.1 tRNA (guanosine(37)-N1)-methyltransferase TrmD [Candidatus Moeniiplasma glomeromycotorum]MCE8169011.1 tRNA (guanosine(37)-N1)-methyltransferase TrmD [Candidatus Moeniiplasma glomeromycotorum]
MKPNFIYLTIFPEYFRNYFSISLPKKLSEKAIFSYRIYDLRDFANNKNKQVDDYPYGGGGGMLLKIEPLVRALATIQEDYPDSYLILLSPQGKRFRQKEVPRLLKQAQNLVFICGHYEGFDERIWYYIDEQISVGDFITMGGEIPALAMTETLIRAIPGAIQPTSYQQETTTSQLDFASYTRPAEYEGLKVPAVLLSGDHAKIAEWRQKNSQEKTQNKRKYYRNKHKIVAKYKKGFTKSPLGLKPTPNIKYKI